MKKLPILLVFILLSKVIFCNPCKEEQDNFFLKITFDEDIVLKDARLLGTDGSQLPVNTATDIFSGYIQTYSVFTLSVTYRKKAAKKDDGLSVSVFLQPGETQIRFKKLPNEYLLTGASAVNHKMFNSLMQSDAVVLTKLLNAESKLNDYLKSDNANLITKMQDSVSGLQNKRASVFAEFVRKNPHSIVSLYAMEILGSIDMENPLEVEVLLYAIDDTLQKTEQMAALRETIEVNKKFMVGQPAPVFSQADTSGNYIALADLKGKYVLIDFWASWCKPCRAQNPSLVKLYNEFKDKHFTILSISLDSKRAAWVNAINDDGMTWLHISDLKFWKNDVAVLYNIVSVPQNVLLDTDGIIIGKNLNEAQLVKRLTQITSKKS